MPKNNDAIHNVKNSDRPLHRRRIVILNPETLSAEKSVEASNLGTKRSVTIPRTIIVRASAERCFRLITKQLEETPHWDPTIMWVNPISIKHVHVGSMSRVTFALDGVREEAVAMVRSFRPNRAILWTSNHSCQLQEEWHLKPEPHGTVVTVILGYSPTGWLLGRLVDKLHMRNKIEEAVVKMLDGLKTAAEES